MVRTPTPVVGAALAAIANKAEACEQAVAVLQDLRGRALRQRHATRSALIRRLNATGFLK
jgi:predicted nucleic acid-binding Zn ribbon protein